MFCEVMGVSEVYCEVRGVLEMFCEVVGVSVFCEVRVYLWCFVR